MREQRLHTVRARARRAVQPITRRRKAGRRQARPEARQRLPPPLASSSQRPSWPAGGASNGHGLGRGAVGPGSRCTATAVGRRPGAGRGAPSQSGPIRVHDSDWNRGKAAAAHYSSPRASGRAGIGLAQVRPSGWPAGHGPGRPRGTDFEAAVVRVSRRRPGLHREWPGNLKDRAVSARPWRLGRPGAGSRGAARQSREPGSARLAGSCPGSCLTRGAVPRRLAESGERFPAGEQRFPAVTRPSGSRGAGRQTPPSAVCRGLTPGARARPRLGAAGRYRNARADSDSIRSPTGRGPGGAAACV